jgi:hypothetical protein
MKNMKLFIGILLGLASFSCGKEQESDLAIELTGSNAYLINATAQSCTNKVAVYLTPSTTSPSSEVAAHYYSFEGATLSWKNTTDTVHIVEMKIEFTNANVTNTCSIAGDELLSIFYDFSVVGPGAAWDGSLVHATLAGDVVTPTMRPSQCKIRCGGVSVVNENKAFIATGTMTLSGFQRSPSGEEKPVKTKTSVKLTYQ